MLGIVVNYSTQEPLVLLLFYCGVISLNGRRGMRHQLGWVGYVGFAIGYV
jgi:hypothetical protein